MCDYSAGGVWSRDGGALGPEHLPISSRLVARIDAWQAVYERFPAFPGDRPLDGIVPDLAAFAAEGLQIAIELKRELPEWTVIYHDESRCEAMDDLPVLTGGYSQEVVEKLRPWFEYEITDAILSSGQPPATTPDQFLNT